MQNTKTSFARKFKRHKIHSKRPGSMAKPLNQVWFRHADIVNGGTLNFKWATRQIERLGSGSAIFRPRKWRLKLTDFVTPI